MGSKLRGFETAAMAKGVAESLWSLYHRRPDTPLLMLPSKRDGVLRVSEQESKIIFTHWLERAGVPYSIETPTIKGYIQQGNSELSARIDVTVYGSSDPKDRILNIELKAGTASVEAFRKDFEKLLRERTDGLWFHTLERATSRTWDALERKMGDAFAREMQHVAPADHSLSFAFAVLERPQLVWFEIDLDGDFEQQWPRVMREALIQPVTPSWAANLPAVKRVPHEKLPVSPQRTGTRKLLVYCPDLCAGSFVHLSIQGASYALRSFVGERGSSRWVQQGAKTTEDLMANYTFVHEVDVTGERKALDSEKQYWIDRITDLNTQHGIGR